MAATYSDQQFVAADPAFQNRVRQSTITACISIKNEAVTTAFHREREAFLVSVMNNPDNYKVIIAQSIATNASVIGDATVGGTVALTSGTAATQAALVTDAHIDAAIASNFNSFFRTPGF